MAPALHRNNTKLRNTNSYTSIVQLTGGRGWILHKKKHSNTCQNYQFLPGNTIHKKTYLLSSVYRSPNPPPAIPAKAQISAFNTHRCSLLSNQTPILMYFLTPIGIFSLHLHQEMQPLKKTKKWVKLCHPEMQSTILLFGTDPDRNRVTWETPSSEAIPFRQKPLRRTRDPAQTQVWSEQVWLNTTFILQGSWSWDKLAVET